MKLYLPLNLLLLENSWISYFQNQITFFFFFWREILYINDFNEQIIPLLFFIKYLKLILNIFDQSKFKNIFYIYIWFKWKLQNVDIIIKKKILLNINMFFLLQHRKFLDSTSMWLKFLVPLHHPSSSFVQSLNILWLNKKDRNLVISNKKFV